MRNLLEKILEENQIERLKISDIAFSKVLENVKFNELSKIITKSKQQILDIFTMYKEKEEFKEAHILIPNANVKKEYYYRFDTSTFPSIKIKDIKNLDLVGLQFDEENSCIHGTPINANTINIQINFISIQDENLVIDTKEIPFIVNADPKDLWQNKPSPIDGRFPKKDNVSFGTKFLDKKIVVASKRGRSHAHEGSFRDDDFFVKKLPDDWSIIAVADGAGSANFARAGSKLVTRNIAENFNDNELLKNISKEVQFYFSNENEANEQTSEIVENIKIKSKSIIINTLYTNVKKLFTELTQFANDEEITLKDIHTTLIFTLIKKFDFGYVILSFGVGDCPINVLENNDTKVSLLNFLDVGEFGGGTRFITMEEIFRKPDMPNRFGINCFKDFSKIFLMTDGIYDPKFVVESKLENIETWNNLLRDLDGENEDQIKVDFQNDENIQDQLSHWMDFWSKGNHDDRTLAIIY